MTRDEVMALSDEELRVKAAELDGWEPAPSIGMWRKVLADGRRHTVFPNKLPDYPHGIAAAWELFEIMLKEHLEPSLSAFLCRKSGEYELEAWARSSKPGELVSTAADTGPLAITRAFVLAMSNEAH